MRQSFFILLLLLFSSSCATLRGSKQRIKIASQPTGAVVFFNGKELGTSPTFIELPRQKKAKLTLLFPNGEARDYPLITSYRWGDSFFSNLLWAVVGAPVAISIDLLTGSAWEYDPITPIAIPGAYLKSAEVTSGKKLDADKSAHPVFEPRTIAIAPPQQDYEYLSDELGVKLETEIKTRYPSDKIQGFQKTRPIFNSFSYNQARKVSTVYRDKLYYELGASHILETTTERRPTGVFIESKLIDIYSGEVVDSFSQLVLNPSLKSMSSGSIFETASSLISIVPNTFFFDITDSSLLFYQNSVKGAVYEPDSEKSDSALTLLTSFALRNSRSPKMDELHGVFRLIPDLNFYYDKFHFNRQGQNNLEGMRFSWLSVAVGFGPELGLDTPMGYFYLQLIPSVAMSWITSSVGDSSIPTFELNTELGYSIFLSQRIVVRLFSRAITGSARQWSNVLSRASSEPLDFFMVSHGIYGLSIGYYFPESRSIVKKFLAPNF